MRALHVLPLALFFSLTCGLCAATVSAQAGPRPMVAGENAASINITISHSDPAAASVAVTSKQMVLYDDGIEHRIQNLTPDPGPARIVLLVDNSRSLRLDMEKMTAALREYAYEIFEGDQLMVVGFDEKAEIISDWTDNAKKYEASLKTLRKQGEPFLFDALSAVVNQALTPYTGAVQKRVIILVSDGLDRGSKTKYAEILSQLQKQDITVYAYKIPDRTGGALRRDQPKPAQVLEQLTEGTGGHILNITEPRESAKGVCDELRNNRYILSYSPTQVSYTDARRLLIVPEDGLIVHYKNMQPPK